MVAECAASVRGHRVSDTMRCPDSASNTGAQANMQVISVTLDTSHFEMSESNGHVVAQANMRDISVTLDTSVTRPTLRCQRQTHKHSCPQRSLPNSLIG